MLFEELAFQSQCEIEGTIAAASRDTAQCRMATENLEQLLEWGWLEEASKGLGVTADRCWKLEVMRYAGLFTVPKANRKMRVISNGVPGNEV